VPRHSTEACCGPIQLAGTGCVYPKGFNVFQARESSPIAVTKAELVANILLTRIAVLAGRRVEAVVYVPFPFEVVAIVLVAIGVL